VRVLFAVVLAAIATGPTDRVAGWRADVDALLEQVRRQHYVYRERSLPPALLQRADWLRREIPRLSDERMLVELLGLMSHLGDGHSYVLPFGSPRVPARVLPVRFHLFSDGLYVIDAEPASERWIGGRVTSIGRVPIGTVLRGLDRYVSRDNPMGVRWIGPFLLQFRGMVEALAPESDPEGIALTMLDRSGREQSVVLETIPAPPIRGVPKLVASRLPGAPPPPLYLENVASPYWFRDLSEDVVYLQFNQVVDDPHESLASFVGRVQRHLAARPIAALVVDVRHNNGGHAELLEPLLDALASFDRNPKARLFVLTGRNTFSAAQIFIARVDARTRAVFAGEPSSSKPNFVGEENEVVLPWSGARGSISNRYHEQIAGDTRTWIEPDIRVELSSKDYFANRDPSLEAVVAEARRRPPKVP
jgi:hypothetical protein